MRLNDTTYCKTELVEVELLLIQLVTMLEPTLVRRGISRLISEKTVFEIGRLFAFL